MRELVLVFSGVLYRFVVYAAVTSFLFSAGVTIDTERGNALYVLKIFCLIWSILIFGALMWWASRESKAQGEQHELRLREWEMEIAARAPVVEPPKPAPRVPFPPYRFVQFIWDRRVQNGKFPTVRECEDEFSKSLVQIWYQQCVEAGAIVGRVEGQYAGDPAPDWDRTRFEEAARRDNTMPYPT